MSPLGVLTSALVEFGRPVIESNTVYMKKSILSFLLCIIFLFTNAQERLITGRVTTAAGVPLSRVSVVIKETGTGATSDMVGSYRITASSSANTSVFTFIGYLNREISIGNRSESQNLTWHIPYLLFLICRETCGIQTAVLIYHSCSVVAITERYLHGQCSTWQSKFV